jgi:hypothetical protein
MELLVYKSDTHATASSSLRNGYDPLGNIVIESILTAALKRMAARSEPFCGSSVPQ